MVFSASDSLVVLVPRPRLNGMSGRWLLGTEFRDDVSCAPDLS